MRLFYGAIAILLLVATINEHTRTNTPRASLACGDYDCTGPSDESGAAID